MPKRWQKDTRRLVLGILTALVLLSALALCKPPEQALHAAISPSLRERSTQGDVIVTYNNLYFVSFCSYTTTGIDAISEKYIGFCGQVIPANEGGAEVAGQLVNYTYRMLGCGQSILYGAKLTIVLTIITVAMGLTLAVFLALGKKSKHKLLRAPCSAYIFFFRGTPLMIQIFVIYLAIPGIFPGFRWRGLFPASDPEAVFKGAFVAALIAFSLNSAAYCAEIVRGAIESVDKGQHEAAKALGLRKGQTMFFVIFPQAIRRMIPAVANEFIMILKDASLVFVIGLMDISTISKAISSGGSYLVFVPALVIYLLITALFSFLFRKLEQRFAIFE